MNIIYFLIGLFCTNKYEDVWIPCCGECGSKYNLKRFYLDNCRKTRCKRCFEFMEYEKLSYYKKVS